MTAPAQARSDLATFLNQRRPFGGRQGFKSRLPLSCARRGRKRDERNGHGRKRLYHNPSVRDGSVIALILRNDRKRRRHAARNEHTQCLE
jgi:hypothetical protein